MTDTSVQTTERKKLRTYRGKVASVSGDKTVRVEMSYLTRHPKYKKILRRRTMAHVHDQNNESGVGDLVEIAKCRPLSKTKKWRLLRVIERNPLQEMIQQQAADQGQSLA